VRIVLDSNILVRSFVRSRGLSHELLHSIVSRNDSLILSNQMLSELTDVLRYPRLMPVHGQSEEAIYEFTSWLREIAIVIPINPLIFAPIRDEKDIFVLQTALSGEANILCTRDRDFFEPPASIFLESRGIDVLTDVELMARLRS
jgi:putative PIN family toxin of toxin-antitoxin system